MPADVRRPDREPAIVPALIVAAILAVLVALLAARLRSAATTIADLRHARERDGRALAVAREEILQMSTTAEELARVQAALEDAQAALASVRAERDDAREAVQALGRRRYTFLAGLAHDLRNPLAPLSNGVELLRLTDHDPAGRLRTRGIMERQIGNLMRIADELSDLARLSGEQPGLQAQRVVLADVLSALADRLQPQLDAQEMTVALDPALQALPPLRGDAARLGQAFQHLLADQIRHADRGTTIRIGVEPVADGIAVAVATSTDVAPGEAANDAAGPVLEDVDAGALGLGVTLADQLVSLHGGTLTARRPAGTRRARFRIALPADGSPATALPAVPQPLPEPAAAALHVLLADDNVDFSHSFGTMLELLGHRVEVVHDGLAAVAAIVASPPDIAFVDIGMPSLDGVEAVRRVRGQGHTQEVLLVAVTGRGGAEDRARAAEAGFDRYLVKPFAMQDVRDALDTAQAIRRGEATRGAGSFASSHVA